MTKHIFSFLLLMGMISSATAGNGEVMSQLSVNTSESKVEWTARKVTGKHTGTVDVKSGKVTMNDGIMTGAAITMDMTSVVVTDLSGSGKSKLEGHLHSDDFFAVDKFPTATLSTTSVKALDEGDYQITADLTIRGITHPITFNATVIPDGKVFRAMANLVVDRTLYDVKYGSGKFFDDLGDSTIYDEFDLKISLVLE